MCVMEIHATARTTTMLQAVAHNITTSANDLETLAATLRGRGEDTGMIGVVTSLRAVALEMSSVVLTQYELEIARHPHVAGDHHHAETVGSERQEDSSTVAATPDYVA